MGNVANGAGNQEAIRLAGYLWSRRSHRLVLTMTTSHRAIDASGARLIALHVAALADAAAISRLAVRATGLENRILGRFVAAVGRHGRKTVRVNGNLGLGNECSMTAFKTILVFN